MRSIRLTPLLLGLAALFACNAGQKPNVTVSLKTTTTPQSSTAGAVPANAVVLSEVRMVVRKITLFPAPTAAATPTTTASDAAVPEADDHDDFPHSSFGPFSVDEKFTSTSGASIHPAFDARVDPGTYAGGLIAINTLPKDAQVTDQVLSDMKGLNASIAIDGTMGGVAFPTFTTAMRVAQWKKGPITVGEGTKNLTLDVDTSGWFTAPDGTALDPTKDNDRGAILENIRCSIRLYEDDDHDGKPDDGDDDVPEGCGGSGGHGGHGGE